MFLEPVIDELVEIFEKGVPDVWDEYKNEHVMIKGVLIATITDLPGRGLLSGEKTKGYTGCVECFEVIIRSPHVFNYHEEEKFNVEWECLFQLY